MIGIIRKVDNMGRIVPPKEIRKKLFDSGDEVEIWVDGDTMYLRKYNRPNKIKDRVRAIEYGMSDAVFKDKSIEKRVSKLLTQLEQIIHK